MKKLKISIVLALLAALCCLLPGCDSSINIPVNYGRVRINIDGLGTSPTARTVFPARGFSSFEYTFTKSGDATGEAKSPDADGFFALEAGSYTVTVKAFVGSGGTSTLAASGISGQFIVTSGFDQTVEVRLSVADMTGTGIFSYSISYPSGAMADITLQSWPGKAPVSLNPVTGGNGKTETLASLPAGTYLFTVLVSNTAEGIYAGISEAVHVYTGLSTEYTKAFAPTDLLSFVPILSAEVTVAPPVKNTMPSSTAVPVTPVGGSVNYTVEQVVWKLGDNIVSGNFVGGEIYTVTITLKADAGYTLASLTADGAIINGQEAYFYRNSDGTVSLVYTFAVKSIAIKTQPSKLAYTHGEALDLSGLVVTLTYYGILTEDVEFDDFADYGITTSPLNDASLVHLTHNGEPVTVTYSGVTPALTAETGNFLTVGPKVITFAVDMDAVHQYTGSPITPAVTVTDGVNPTPLTLSTDYTVAYDNNTDVGTLTSSNPPTVIITGVGNYVGSSASVKFTISNTAFTVTNNTQWNEAVDIISNAGSDSYTITVNGDVGVAGGTANTFGTASDITVTLNGNGKLFLNSQGSLIRIGEDQTVILNSADLTLQGTANNTALVHIEGGPLATDDGGTFTMENGTIMGNSNTSGTNAGGGVLVDHPNGIFTMNGGAISGNSALGYCGGGVAINNGEFYMSDGTISNNAAGTAGGGVYASSGTFTMTGGIISGNDGGGAGGGVHVTASSTFHLVNGMIYGAAAIGDDNNGNPLKNTASDGAALFANAATGTSTAQCGTFSGNTWNRKDYLFNTADTIDVLDGDLMLTPIADDYIFGNLTQTANNIMAVAITPKSGKSTGTIVRIYYNGTGVIPQTAGTYIVTFDVAEAPGWRAALGLPAGTLQIDKVEPNVNWPTGLTATYGQTLGNITLPDNGSGTAGSFSWKTGNSTLVGDAGTRQHSVTFTPTETGIYITTDKNDVDVVVAKAAGAAVNDAPTADTITSNSVTLNPVTVDTTNTDSDQTVEYAYGTSSSESTSAWQDGLTFSTLTPSTTYFFFARAKENANYEAGTAQVSAGIATTTPGQVEFVYHWGDDIGTISILVSSNVSTNFNPYKIQYNSNSGSATFQFNGINGGTNYMDHLWTLNGINDGTGQTYTFSTSRARGNYIIGLRVQAQGSGKYYYTEIPVTIY